MTFASGRQHVIAWEDQEAVVAGGDATLCQYEADGRHVIDPARGAALHGPARWTGFDVAGRGAFWVTLVHRMHPQAGYPFLLDVTIRYGLSDDGLRVDMLVENRGGWMAPAGLGQHPCLLPLESGLDVMYADLDRDADGVCSVVLRGGERALRLWMDEGFRYLAISSPHGPNGRSLTVAPMTCPPNAMASGEDAAALDPGQSLRAAWGIEVLHR